VLSPSNGGVVNTVSYTLNAVVDECNNNDVVLSLGCALSTGLMVPKSRVTGVYGGYCGAASPTLPSTCPAATTASTTTASNTTASNTTTSRRRLNTTNDTNTSNTTTVVVPTTSSVSVYV